MCPPQLTQCDIPIEKIDIIKKGSANDRQISREYLPAWGTSHGKVIPIKRHFSSLIFAILLTFSRHSINILSQHYINAYNVPVY